MVSVKKALESLYSGVCNIREYGEVFDSATKKTRHEEKVVLESQPCRLSFKNLISADKTPIGAAITQSIVLFIAPEVVIKPGSKISVTQNGVTTDYKNSGTAAVYQNHQEIPLVLFKDWA